MIPAFGACRVHRKGAVDAHRSGGLPAITDGHPATGGDQSLPLEGTERRVASRKVTNDWKASITSDASANGHLSGMDRPDLSFGQFHYGCLAYLGHPSQAFASPRWGGGGVDQQALGVG